MEQDRALRVLEFTKIRERLAAHALTDMGKEKCLALVPYDDVSEVLRALDETEEACVLLSYLGGQPLVAFPDVREQVTLAQKGACLSQRALLDVAACLRATRAARSALVRDREDTPILTGLATRLTALDGIENDISAAIISEEEIEPRLGGAPSDPPSDPQRQRAHARPSQPDDPFLQLFQVSAGQHHHHAGRPLLRPREGRMPRQRAGSGA